MIWFDLRMTWQFGGERDNRQIERETHTQNRNYVNLKTETRRFENVAPVCVMFGFDDASVGD